MIYVQEVLEEATEVQEYQIVTFEISMRRSAGIDSLTFPLEIPERHSHLVGYRNQGKDSQ